MTDLEKASDFLRGVAAGDPDLATRHVDLDAFVEHGPLAARGAIKFWKRIDGLPKAAVEIGVIRTVRDDRFIVMQLGGPQHGQSVVFEVFRVENGLVIEHWTFSAADGTPNESGHTQADGPTAPRHLAATARNKVIVREYYETVHLRGEQGQARRWFHGDVMIRHEPGVADGVDAFLRDLAVLTQDRTIDAISLLAGEGDLVFLVANGTHRDEPCSYVDLYRVEEEKIVEHWGFPTRSTDFLSS